jgi:four helix bundle protein
MNKQSKELRDRTKSFSLRIIALYGALPPQAVSQVIGKQLIRSATSVGAHVREGKHSRSAAELFSKLSVGLQEMEETRYWLELLEESGLVKPGRLVELHKQADALIAILFSGTKTLKTRIR